MPSTNYTIYIVHIQDLKYLANCYKYFHQWLIFIIKLYQRPQYASKFQRVQAIHNYHIRPKVFLLLAFSICHFDSREENSYNLLYLPSLHLSSAAALPLLLLKIIRFSFRLQNFICQRHIWPIWVASRVTFSTIYCKRVVKRERSGKILSGN